MTKHRSATLNIKNPLAGIHIRLVDGDYLSTDVKTPVSKSKNNIKEEKGLLFRQWVSSSPLAPPPRDELPN